MRKWHFFRMIRSFDWLKSKIGYQQRRQSRLRLFVLLDYQSSKKYEHIYEYEGQVKTTSKIREDVYSAKQRARFLMSPEETGSLEIRNYSNVY